MRVAIISGSRADRGPLEAVRDELQGHGEFEVEWMAGGEDVIEEPDLAILLGDRIEILRAAVECNHLHYPIAHISGGDITEGSQDDCFRHAITKLSHIHFPSNEDSARRIIQMGEEPWRVHMVGAPSIDRLRKTELLDKRLTMEIVYSPPSQQMVMGDIIQAIAVVPQRTVLVSYHPNTLGDTASELNELIAALNALDSDIGLVLIGPNHDEGWGLIDTAWKLLASTRPNTVYHPHLDSQLYLSLMKHCDVMVGNSSAMIYEASYYGTPCVMIGDRQQGRPRPFPVATQHDKIVEFISLSFGRRSPRQQLFGDGHACERIAKVLKELPDKATLLRKKFPEAQLVDYGEWNAA